MEYWGGTAQCHKGFDVQCTRIKIYPIHNSLGMMPLQFQFPTASHQCCTLFGTIQQSCQHTGAVWCCTWRGSGYHVQGV